MENDDIYCWFQWGDFFIPSVANFTTGGKRGLLLLFFASPFCRRFLLLLLLARPRRVPFNLAEILASPTKGNVHRYTQHTHHVSLSLSQFGSSVASPSLLFVRQQQQQKRIFFFFLYFSGKIKRKSQLRELLLLALDLLPFVRSFVRDSVPSI